jgi:Phosphoenolpyruvate-protein kinase (PTS system EI component in bacteria)
MIIAIGVSTGVGVSKAMVFKRKNVQIPSSGRGSISDELEKIDYCVTKTTEELKGMYGSIYGKGDPLAKVLNIYIKIINNPQLIADIKDRVKWENVSAEYAITHTLDGFKKLVQNLDDEYLYDKSGDIEEIKRRLLSKLIDFDTADLDSINEECIVVAEDLTPRDILSMDPKVVKGIVTILGGPASSSALMARYLNIPAVIGAGYEGLYIKNGDLLIVDADKGRVIVNPDEDEIQEYRKYEYRA